MEIRSIKPWARADEGVYEVQYTDDLGRPNSTVVFAPNEVVAIVKANEAYETNRGVIALQKLTGRIK